MRKNLVLKQKCKNALIKFSIYDILFSKRIITSTFHDKNYNRFTLISSILSNIPKSIIYNNGLSEHIGYITKIDLWLPKGETNERHYEGKKYDVWKHFASNKNVEELERVVDYLWYNIDDISYHLKNDFSDILTQTVEFISNFEEKSEYVKNAPNKFCVIFCVGVWMLSNFTKNENITNPKYFHEFYTELSYIYNKHDNSIFNIWEHSNIRSNGELNSLFIGTTTNLWDTTIESSKIKNIILTMYELQEVRDLNKELTQAHSLLFIEASSCEDEVVNDYILKTIEYEKKNKIIKNQKKKRLFVIKAIKTVCKNRYQVPFFYKSLVSFL